MSVRLGLVSGLAHESGFEVGLRAGPPWASLISWAGALVPTQRWAGAIGGFFLDLTPDADRAERGEAGGRPSSQLPCQGAPRTHALGSGHFRRFPADHTPPQSLMLRCGKTDP